MGRAVVLVQRHVHPGIAKANYACLTAVGQISEKTWMRTDSPEKRLD
jgi:hypothetical protein